MTELKWREPSPSDWDRWLSLVLKGRDPSEAARELRLTASAFRRENPGKHAAVLDLSREVRAGADRDLVRDKLREVTANTEHPQWGKSTELLAKTAGMLDDRTRLEVTGAEGGPVQIEDRSATLADMARILDASGALVGLAVHSRGADRDELPAASEVLPAPE
jgi:hypothetical protein